MNVKLKNLYRFLLYLSFLLVVIFAYTYINKVAPSWLKIAFEKTKDAQSPPVFATNFNGPQNSPFSGPLGIAVNKKGWIYVVDSGNSKVRVLDTNGKFLFEFGRFGQKPGEFDYPNCLAIDAEDRVYVGDFNNSRIQVFSPQGVLIKILNQWKTTPLIPLGLTFDSSGKLYVANCNGKILIISNQGQLIKEFGQVGALDGYLSYPNGIAVDQDGYIYVTDSGNARLQIFDQEGRFIKKLEPPKYIFSLPTGITIDSQSRIYVVDTLMHAVSVFDQTLKPLFTFGIKGLNEGQLNFPNGITLDDQGKIYVTDRENNRIVIYSYSNKSLF